MSEPIHVDVWSDIACPWCYLGKHRFEEGMAQFKSRNPDAAVEVESHSFELAPDTPEAYAGSEVDFLVGHKGMPPEQVEQMLAQMTQLAASENITFDFERLHHINTRRTHRLLHLAKAHGVQAQLQERLFRAYFAEGRELNDPQTLAELGVEVGLDPQEVHRALEDPKLGEAVDRDIAQAQALGIAGVPFWVIDNKYSLSGAQPAAQIAQALEQVWKQRQAEAR